MRLGFDFVPFPREIWDRSMELTQAEFRLLGWFLSGLKFGIRQEEFTDAELLNGNKDGRPSLGLSRNSMKTARTGLIEKKFIEGAQVGGGENGQPAVWRYRLVLSDSDSKAVKDSQLSCQGLTPKLSNFDSTIKEVKEKPETTEKPDNKPLSNDERSTAGDCPFPEGKPAKRKRSDPRAPTRFGSPEVMFSHLTKDQWEIESMCKLWAFYLDETGKNPLTYALTETRARCGLARLRDAHKLSATINGRTEEQIKARAYGQFERAIKNLAGDEFLNGGNDRGKKYVDWVDHLCKSWQTFEKRRGN